MLLAVHLYVSFEVVLQELAAVVLGESVHESLEHLGDGVLSSVEELRGDIGDGFIKAAHCVIDENFDVGWNFGLVEGIINRCSLPKRIDVVLDDTGVSLDLFHGLDVQLEVRSMTMFIGMPISFLSQDDLVNEPSSAPGCRWEPDAINTSQVPLECLQKKHEVPNGKDMSLHKGLDLGLMVDSLVNLMAMEGLLQDLEL